MLRTLRADDIKQGFDDRIESLFFAVGQTEYVVIADYSDLPLIEAMLCFEDEDCCLTPLSDGGEPYDVDDEPQPWRGLPMFVAERIVSAVNCHAT